MSSTVTPSRQAALAAYRKLLRTQREVFGGDLPAIQAARKETHSRFMSFKDETNVSVLEEKLKLANQVVSLLRHNVVQGVPKGENTFELRITRETELGDNESVKVAQGGHRKGKGKGKAAAGGCCGGH